MADAKNNDRKDRLSAALRENLKRRKQHCGTGLASPSGAHETRNPQAPAKQATRKAIRPGTTANAPPGPTFASLHRNFGRPGKVSYVSRLN